MTISEDLESGHEDRVTVIDINYDGSKLLTASVDHKVKVYNINRQTGERVLIESWTAHDADIRDAKWLHPSTGTHFATIGNDLKFHLWQEDPHQSPRHGRRFKLICTIPSKPRVPFVSLDFKVIDNLYTFLALIDRQGLLSVYEPTNPDEFREWTLVDQFNVCTPPLPGRGDQTCFKVRFDQNIIPLPYINCVSDEKRQLSLVVTAMNEVKIYRSVKAEDHETGTDGVAREGGVAGNENVGGAGMTFTGANNDEAASRRFTFFEAAKLPVHPALIRDVQWAPFNVRGTDIFATACRDGAVRIFEMSVSENKDSSSRDPTNTSQPTTNLFGSTQAPSTDSIVANNATRQPAQSSLSSAIAGRNASSQASNSNNNTNTSHSNTSNQPHSPNATTNTNTNNNSVQQQQQQQPLTSPSHPHHHTTTTSTNTAHTRTTHTFPYTHTITIQANLESAHTDAWSIRWDPQGQVLMSGGADGVTKIWRRSVLDFGMNVSSSSSTTMTTNTGGGGSTSHSPDSTRVERPDLGGKWILFADQAVNLGGSGGGSGVGTDRAGDEDSDVSYDE